MAANDRYGLFDFKPRDSEFFVFLIFRMAATAAGAQLMTEKDILLVISTAPDAVTAERIARELVTKSLAACANIVPAVRSIYLWKGAVESEGEALMLLKTTTDRLPELRETLLAAHPYELPEVIALPVTDGHHPYLQWVAAMSSAPLKP